MRRRHFLGATSALPFLPACGGSSDGPAAAGGEADVALTFQGLHVTVPARVDGLPLTLVVDTGADQTLLRPQVADRLGLVLSKETYTGHGPTGVFGEVHAATLDRLEVGDAWMRGLRVFVMDLPAELPCDGILGATFFQAFVVRLGHAARRFTAWPVGGGPRVPAGTLRFAMPRRETLLVEADVGGVAGWYSVDTGAANTVTLFRPTVERRGLRQRFAPARRLPASLSANGVMWEDIVRAPALRLGGFEFARPVAHLSLAESGLFGSDRWTGNLGAELWRRFEMTIDVAGGAIHLEPNAAAGERFAGPTSGVAARWFGERLEVVAVAEGSPAFAAGLRAGMVVEAVDGVAVSPTDRDRLRHSLQGPVGVRRVLNLRGPDGAPHVAAFTIEELV